MSETVLNFGCPSCHNAVRSTTDKTGSTIQCPSCKCFITVPSDYFSSTLVESDSRINYQCPACSKPYHTLSANAGQKRTCTDCSYVITVPPSSTFAPNQHQESNRKAHSSSGEEQSKLVDCPDCGTSISRLALSCLKCGRPITADPHLIAISWSLSAILGTLVVFMLMLILNEIFRGVILSSLNNR
jgi:DNA-directed RNA polymerase subunit RPC12/RpoP